MTLSTGTKLSHYEILSLIGHGGMGEVYKAKDQKLGRDVAIKVLPEEFAKDTDRIARFQREAKLLASLNYPNIASIYGLEESNGTHFLVLELIEGDTLADQIKEGPLLVEEALKLALQIAEALEAAHERGIIHRDLKPANIKVTPEGKIKVLDFGLAKAFAPEQEEMILSDSPTLSAAATQKGVILGTAGYMSPEQAKGKSLDKRTDVWAFGCVLYEMLTGEAAFQGEDVTEILASVVKASVNLEALPKNLHPRVREVVGRCLQKDLRKRFADIGDMRYEIEAVLGGEGGGFIQPFTVEEPQKKAQQMLIWALLTVILIAITGIIVWNMRSPELQQVIRFDYELPEVQGLSNPVYPSLSVSPNGMTFVYSTRNGLYLRSMNELAAKFIAGSEGETAHPFFSPDGLWVGYISISDGMLKKISVNGGSPVTLCAVPSLIGASWNEQSAIVYSDSGAGIMKISSNGGEPETLIKSVEEPLYHPRLLPDGKSIMFTVSMDGEYKIAIQSSESNSRKVLFPGNFASYMSTGHIIFGSENNIAAAAVDLKNLNSTGAPIPVVEGVYRAGDLYPLQFAVSDSGTLVYIPEGISAIAASLRDLFWVDRNGKEEKLKIQSDAYNSVKISPNGTELAFSVNNSGGSDLYTWNFTRSVRNRLTFNPGSNANPLWTLDGKQIVFWSNGRREGIGSLYLKAANGTGEEELVDTIPGAMRLWPSSWSADNKYLVLTASSGDFNVGAILMGDEPRWMPLFREAHVETHPRISRDGQFIAYTSSESGQFQVYVCPFPDVSKGGRWQISEEGGLSPLWSPSGNELFYRTDDAVMAVSVETGPTFKKEEPAILFRDNYIGFTAEDALWDIHPNGKKFLMMKPAEATEGESSAAVRRKINIILNWFEELEQLAPIP